MWICVNNLLIQLEFHQIVHWPDQISTGICPRASANFGSMWHREKMTWTFSIGKEKCISTFSQFSVVKSSLANRASGWDVSTGPASNLLASLVKITADIFLSGLTVFHSCQPGGWHQKKLISDTVVYIFPWLTPNGLVTIVWYSLSTHDSALHCFALAKKLWVGFTAYFRLNNIQMKGVFAHITEEINFRWERIDRDF